MKKEIIFMNGIITGIQRFSLNDGDGIRTTVFLQGCNMRCAWCHNPEGLSFKAAPLYYARKCIGCGHCFAACKTGARSRNFDRALCIGCGACANACYPGAIVMSGYEVTVADVVREAKQDQIYYNYSTGGVTFSGGEALCQTEFVLECADALLNCGIPCAIETNLMHEFTDIAPALKRMSAIMADIKLIDDAEHIKWTGVSNREILKNARKLGELGVPIVFRTPVIPGATDGIDNLLSIAEFASSIPNAREFELLNFNPLGADKYTALGLENPFAGARPYSHARMAEFKVRLSGAGIPVRVS